MTQIPEGTQFIGISPDVSLVQKRSQLINDESAGYTAFQIAQAAGLATVTDVTYDELVALIDASSLVVGGVYRITDFQTLHEIPNTTERNDTNVEIPIEVLVCIASSTNTLFSQVQSEDYPDDIIYYTVDNTAWKDLQIDGQKGCITLRIDPINNIEVGNGDWRNFIVRRWAFDYTAYNNVGIKWFLFDPNYGYLGCTTTGGYESMPAISTSVYNAATNPYGYKDVRLFATGMTVVNCKIKKRTDSTSEFPMPNFYHGGQSYNGQSANIKNFYVSNINNVSFFGEIYSATFNSITGCIFLSGLNYAQSLKSPDFLNVFTNLNFKGMTGLSKIVQCSIIDETSYIWGCYENYRSTFEGLDSSRIVLQNPTGSNKSTRPGISLQNIGFTYLTIARTTQQQSFTVNQLQTAILGNTFTDLSAQTTNIFYDPKCKSTFETTSAAIAAMAMANNVDRVSGIWNLTGSGTVNIDTFTRLQQNNFPITLKPASGLTISIDQNNVANGFVNSGTITANGTNGEVIILTPISDRWKAS